MKTTLAILVAGLFLLGTPLMATAHGGGHERGGKHHKTWVKEKHDHHYYYNDHRPHKGKKQLKKKIHRQRHQIQRLKHRIRQQQYQRHHLAHYNDFWFSAPRVVFHFGW